MKMFEKQIKLANPRGFCAGVDRAIDIVNRALEIHGAPVYVKHEVVHNKFVVEDLKKRGAIFIEEINEIPDGSLVIFSAHGVSDKVEAETKERNLDFYDATCPLVTKVHMEVVRHARANRDIILIGHEGHPEVEGTMGRHIDKKNSKMFKRFANLWRSKDTNTKEITIPANSKPDGFLHEKKQGLQTGIGGRYVDYGQQGGGQQVKWEKENKNNKGQYKIMLT